MRNRLRLKGTRAVPMKDDGTDDEKGPAERD